MGRKSDSITASEADQAIVLLKAYPVKNGLAFFSILQGTGTIYKIPAGDRRCADQPIFSVEKEVNNVAFSLSFAGQCWLCPSRTIN